MGIKVVFTSPDNGGCKFYRGWMPLTFCNEAGITEGYTSNSVYPYDWCAGETKVIDVIGFQRPVTKEILKFIHKLAPMSYVDIDDNFFDLHPGNPCYWDLEESRKNMGYDPIMDVHLQALKECEIVTVTTPHLANAIARHANREKNIAVVPNGFYSEFSENQIDEQVAARGRHEKIRIGWWGGMHHNEDFSSVCLDEMLANYAIDNYDKVSFIFLGWVPLKMLETSVVEFNEWENVTGFYKRLFNLDLDICMGPLVDNEFNRSKSNIKFLETAMYKRPFITNTHLVFDELEDGKTAMVANGPVEFVEKLDALVRNADLRKTIGANAYEFAHANYHIDKIVPKWNKIFSHLKDRADRMVQWWTEEEMNTYLTEIKHLTACETVTKTMLENPVSRTVFNSYYK